MRTSRLLTAFLTLSLMLSGCYKGKENQNADLDAKPALESNVSSTPPFPDLEQLESNQLQSDLEVQVDALNRLIDMGKETSKSLNELSSPQNSTSTHPDKKSVDDKVKDLDYAEVYRRHMYDRPHLGNYKVTLLLWFKLRYKLRVDIKKALEETIKKDGIESVIGEVLGPNWRNELDESILERKQKAASTGGLREQLELEIYLCVSALGPGYISPRKFYTELVLMLNMTAFIDDPEKKRQNVVRLVNLAAGYGSQRGLSLTYVVPLSLALSRLGYSPRELREMVIVRTRY